MAITRVETQVTWAGPADTDSVDANSSEESLEFNLHATAVSARITLKAKNSTTPAADDHIDFYLIETSGDPDGASGDEFSTTEHARWLATLDTFTEDPAIKTVHLPIPQKGAKIIARGDHPDTTTNAITVSATITEQRAA